MAADDVPVENSNWFYVDNTTTSIGYGQMMVENLIVEARSFLAYKIGK